MLEKLIQLDRNLLVFLNSLGSEQFDPFWLFITKQLHLTPFFIVILYLVHKKTGGWKHFLIIVVTIALLITVTDQFTNLVKNSVQRLRPCNEPAINSIIRIVKSSSSFSFFSGHAANSMASTVVVFMILKKHYKYAFLLFLFPLIFAYSRIYLGLHYPLDILTGYTVGAVFGYVFYNLYRKVSLKYFSEILQNPTDSQPIANR
ncbi:phosphatase PAP2 family protein [Flavobacterium sp. H122]|uniref:phosphatase PAP2 family protein n=1 Tax=Flavobacterium sp. H122 TaxID=2529860 RepID=UPI0010AA4B26|nr:phosphatase PAP2 family protein [Flavobacterium sp. H122]